jgi:hypothetical protein
MRDFNHSDYFCLLGKPMTECWRDCSQFADCWSAKGSVLRLEYLKHKWPTPLEFEEDYGLKPIDDTACYVQGRENDKPVWKAAVYGDVQDKVDTLETVIACTPYGCPDGDWKPADAL